MVFEPNFTKVVSSIRKPIGTTQSMVELKLPTNENDISRVYSVGARSTILKADINNKEIVFGGLVDFQAVYESAGVSALDYTAEFKDKFLSDADITGELIITSNVIDVTSSVASGGIKVVAIVETVFDEIVSSELNVLTDVSGDNSHIATNELCYSTYLGRAYEKFDLSEEFQIDNVTNILMITPCLSLNKVEPRENYIVVSGKLNLDICYKSGAEIRDIDNHYHDIDFSWEVAFDGVDGDSTIQSVLDVITNEIRVSTTIENGAASVNVYIPVAYSGYVFKENKIMIVEDMYLEKNYTSITCENFYTISCNNSISFKDNISGTAGILDSAPFIDEVLGVCSNNLILASSRINDGLLCIEGIANSTVVYFTKETNEITSVQVEMPFAVEQKVDGEVASVVTLCLSNLTARSKRGKEIEVSAELNVYADVYAERQECVISQVSLGDKKPQDDCCLFVYVVRQNQTIWDIAKDTNTSQELILEQNPDVELPIKAGDKLVVYNPNIMKF